jgi:outer membrane scaffolding protein for murein synthesis (MipA/OmpV family)
VQYLLAYPGRSPIVEDRYELNAGLNAIYRF